MKSKQLLSEAKNSLKNSAVLEMKKSLSLSSDWIKSISLCCSIQNVKRNFYNQECILLK